MFFQILTDAFYRIGFMEVLKRVGLLLDFLLTGRPNDSGQELHQIRLQHKVASGHLTASLSNHIETD